MTEINHPPMTDSQKKALKWLRDRGGSGTFDKHGVLIASGEGAPFMRSTWNGLQKIGLLAFSNPTGKSYGRASLTEKGMKI